MADAVKAEEGLRLELAEVHAACSRLCAKGMSKGWRLHEAQRKVENVETRVRLELELSASHWRRAEALRGEARTARSLATSACLQLHEVLIRFGFNPSVVSGAAPLGELLDILEGFCKLVPELFVRVDTSLFLRVQAVGAAAASFAMACVMEAVPDVPTQILGKRDEGESIVFGVEHASAEACKERAVAFLKVASSTMVAMVSMFPEEA